MCKLHSCILWMCLYALLHTWQTECVSGQMLHDVVQSYTLPEWVRIFVLSFIVQRNDSSCDNPWLSTKLPRWPNLLRASHLYPSVPLCWLVCLSVCMWPRLDFEGLENGEEGFLDKTKSWSRSIEDLHHTGTQPFCNTLVRSARQSVLRYVWLS